MTVSNRVIRDRLKNYNNMTKNDIDYQIAMLVVNSYKRVDERIAKLKELNYDVCSQWVKSGGIGTIRTMRNCSGVQISAAKGGNSFVGMANVAYK